MSRKRRLPLAERLACAVLLFHSRGAWVDKKEAAWMEVTRTREATSAVLVEMARQLLANENRRRERAKLSAPSGNPAAPHDHLPALRPGEP